MRPLGKSEFDDGSDLRTPLQQAYGAGDPNSDVWTGALPEAPESPGEALARHLAETLAEQEPS